MTPPKRPSTPPQETCDHGLRWMKREGERLCALEYLNRFVAPNRVQEVAHQGRHLYLVFASGERLECCCEECGESHGDDPLFTEDVKEVALGRRALRFRLERDSGHLVVWFARGDHLHLHRNSLLRFHLPRPARPASRGRGRPTRSVRPTHTPPPRS